MLIEEVYRSQDLDATLSSMSDDEEEDEDEDAYLPPLKAVMGELPSAGVRQKPKQVEQEEVDHGGEEVRRWTILQVMSKGAHIGWKRVCRGVVGPMLLVVCPSMYRVKCTDSSVYVQTQVC